MTALGGTQCALAIPVGLYQHAVGLSPQYSTFYGHSIATAFKFARDEMLSLYIKYAPNKKR